ncbi:MULTISPECIES: hypothetical protein [unclassified Arenibacter]|uniref:hypothetical protein n=1 Tax=unclassified Arenibacter TaxID=2615047 RepID=UPI0011C1B2D9|nr:MULTISPECIES: hypothetical protein [unclassified Arenibacter]
MDNRTIWVLFPTKRTSHNGIVQIGVLNWVWPYGELAGIDMEQRNLWEIMGMKRVGHLMEALGL